MTVSKKGKKKMIYRADFSISSSSSKLISPVIFGAIADKVFELTDEKQAKELVFDMAQNVLISDALPSEEEEDDFTRYFYVPRIIPPYEDDQNSLSLREKRELARKNKKLAKSISLVQIDNSRILKEADPSKVKNPVDFYRIGIQVNRKSGASEEGIFFYHQEFRFSKKQCYSIYIQCKKPSLVNKIEECFKVIELTGFGPDVSIGKGKISFLRHNQRVLCRDKVTEQFFDSEPDVEKEYVNIASTILFDKTVSACQFKSYQTFRYDSKGYDVFKPPYFCAERGSVVVPKGKDLSFLIEYKGRFIYTCIFPLRLIQIGGEKI